MVDDALLEVGGLSVRYGPVQALRGISFSVGRGEIVALIGANGAGKSTTLRALSGIVRPASGDILFGGRSIAGASPAPGGAPWDGPRPRGAGGCSRT